MYSTLEVSKLTGASLRQIDYWKAQQIVVPSTFKRGQRSYSRQQVKELAFIFSMRKCGVSLRTIRSLLTPIRANTFSIKRVVDSIQVLDSAGITL
jgi:DNA-binding transcriptional MerR regulator